MVRVFLTPCLFLLLACGTTSAPPVTAGAACNEENAGACESATRLLGCQSRVWVVVSDCKGALGCRRTGDSVDCDTRGNSVGDSCSTETRVRCDPDGGTQILRCRGGRLTFEQACPTLPVQQFCVQTDGGLTCE